MLKYRGGRLKEVRGKGEIGPKSSHVQSLRSHVASDGLAGSLAALGKVYFTVFNLLIFADPTREYAEPRMLSPRMLRDDCTVLVRSIHVHLR